MQIGMIGLGRMGGNMARRLMAAGHEVVVYSTDETEREIFAKDTGAFAASSIDELVAELRTPRVVWLMVPAAVTEEALGRAARLAQSGDILVDGGNSHYTDDIRRAEELGSRGILYVDCGTSGGIWGLERGYCLMIGGPEEAVRRLDPIFKALAPGRGGIPRTVGREKSGGTAEEGYLHCGPAGAGHFVKMVHNGIEYGIMAAYAEGFNILRHADAGSEERPADAETAPLRRPAEYRYPMNLADIAELWRRGSVIGSWLLDLAAAVLVSDPTLAEFKGTVSDSGEGRWAVKAAVDEGVPAPVLTAALYERYRSRGQAGFADKLLSALRSRFGGHPEKRLQNSLD